MQFPLAALVTLVAAQASHAGLVLATYDASTGLLPPDVCWNQVNPNQAPAPTLVKGAVLLGPTVSGTNCYFRRDLPPMNFNDGGAVTASVKIDASTWYAVNPYKRTGFSLHLSDETGRWAHLGIASDRILLHTSDVNWSDFTYLFDSTGGFHTYRLEFQGNTVKAIIDGNVVLTDTAGTGGTPNVAYFGDITALAWSTSRTAWITVEGLSDCAQGDLDCDGNVDAEDLAVLLGAWGSSDCAADINDDGVVNAIDLGILLGSWG